MRHCITWQYSVPVLTTPPRQDEQCHRSPAASEGPGQDDGRKTLRESPHAKPRQERTGIARSDDGRINAWCARRTPCRCPLRSTGHRARHRVVLTKRRGPVQRAQTRVHRTSIAPGAETCRPCLRRSRQPSPRRSRRPCLPSRALFQSDLCGGSHDFLYRFRVRPRPPQRSLDALGRQADLLNDLGQIAAPELDFRNSSAFRDSSRGAILLS